MRGGSRLGRVAERAVASASSERHHDLGKTMTPGVALATASARWRCAVKGLP